MAPQQYDNGSAGIAVVLLPQHRARAAMIARWTSETIVMKLFKLIWSFHGRIGRATYAGGLLLNLFWASAVSLGLIYLGRDEMLAAYPSPSLLAIPLTPLFTGAKVVVLTLFTWGKCALMARRLHDLGQNGWICLVVFIPVINVIAVISLLIARGDEFDNPYGPNRNPLDGSGTETLALNR
jgi:uncharacterized membrane protein YhaH (DUF805 family)